MRLRASAMKATRTTLQSHHAITPLNWRPRKSATAFLRPMVAMPPKTPLLWSDQTKNHDTILGYLTAEGGNPPVDMGKTGLNHHNNEGEAP